MDMGIAINSGPAGPCGGNYQTDKKETPISRGRKGAYMGSLFLEKEVFLRRNYPDQVLRV